ncbi:halomucin [Acrasis kona]|uniref:Halomucin n=1 Tax=Acrasis kona TaxID=1008807 RepID=A0AAW2Z2N3_9EUKA
MATDFNLIADKNKKFITFLEQKGLESSALVIPKNPHLYHQYYQKLNKKRGGSSLSQNNDDDDDRHSTGSDDSFLQNDEDNDMYLQEGLNPSSGRTSQLVNFSPIPDEDENEISDSLKEENHDEQNDVSRPHTGRFGKVTKFSTVVDVKTYAEEENSNNNIGNFFMTETKINSAAGSLRNGVRKPSTHSIQDQNILEDIQLQMSLPPLLVHQHYNDRSRRHKKYSEPLVTIRHEDLLEQLEQENPHMTYKGKPLNNKSKDLLSGKAVEAQQSRNNFVAQTQSLEDTLRSLDEQSKLHKVNLRSTKKGLEKREAAMKRDGGLDGSRSNTEPMGYSNPKDEHTVMVNSKLSDVISTTRNVRSQPNTFYNGSGNLEVEEKDDLEFHTPNLSQDIERLKRAQITIMEHLKLQEQLKLNQL